MKEETPKRRISDALNRSGAYVLITPARNEAAFLEATIKSVAQQTLKPLKWVIVSDGSTDGTDELVSKYAAQHDWIELVVMPARRARHFAGKVGAFNAGFERVKELDYAVIGNLDADITFPDANYFAFLMAKFADNSRLGVAGTSYREGDVVFPLPFASREDVFGACQMFSRECFQAIGGYTPLKSGGIDVIAVLAARASGWQTTTFDDIACVHHRSVASAQHAGICRRLFNEGAKDYLLGSHPLWETFRSFYRIKHTPYIIGGALLFAGYFWSMLRGADKTIPDKLMAIRRNEQMQRLKGILRLRHPAPQRPAPAVAGK